MVQTNKDRACRHFEHGYAVRAIAGCRAGAVYCKPEEGSAGDI